MKGRLYFPLEDLILPNSDFNLGADYVELTAFFAFDSQVLIDQSLRIPTADEFQDTSEDDIDIVDEQAVGSSFFEDTLKYSIVEKIDQRRRVLGDAYPFKLDCSGETLTFPSNDLSKAQTAYVLSLVLSNLKSMSSILDRSGLHPDSGEERKLRNYFQYFATAALAAELNGRSWSFGFPRHDGSGFFEKLNEIWEVIRDGKPQAAPSAPKKPKDGEIDVFAIRKHPDDLPGFLFAVAQVATGRDWTKKSIYGKFDRVFTGRWFNGEKPVFQVLHYHIIPFARPDESFRDDCLNFGNVLHRLRVPYLVAEIEQVPGRCEAVEAFGLLSEAVEWIASYSNRMRES